MIANQIPFAWLAFFEGGHSFLYTEPKHFADRAPTPQRKHVICLCIVRVCALSLT